ncbi:MAG: putative transporter ATP-binding protein [Streptosporangiaceae bacterium]|jgi:putative ABC transport system ATP-binding protein|nr:putative transporter ATP-binding protein [Streptosporangiaceae bacterium]
METAGPPAGGAGEPADQALEARSLYRFFRAGEEETLALQGVSLSLAPGEVVAVSGPSGSGKSTLLSCLAGLDEPDGGTVLVGGRRISHQPEPTRARLRARHIGVLFQSANLFEHLTVEGNLSLSQGLARKDHRTDRKELLESVGLSARAHAYPSELSGGESARAGLALALANDPIVLLADEPTGELDSATEAQILDLLLSRARAGAAVLVASHSPAVAAAADRVIRLFDGKVLS